MNVAQGMLYTTGDAIKTPSELIRLWMHEATRVYSDKLVDANDNETFAKLILDVIKKNCDVSITGSMNLKKTLGSPYVLGNVLS